MSGGKTGKITYLEWRCPFWGCGHKTRYARTIRRHLELHGLGEENIRRSLAQWWRACSQQA
ncbi:MAG: hypothetical protein QXR87_07145 [Candidatus Hadarchaeales archaeon]